MESAHKRDLAITVENSREAFGSTDLSPIKQVDPMRSSQKSITVMKKLGQDKMPELIPHKKSRHENADSFLNTYTGFKRKNINFTLRNSSTIL
jgi:hypothetical protein